VLRGPVVEANTSRGLRRNDETETREAAVRASSATAALGYLGPTAVPPVGECAAAWFATAVALVLLVLLIILILQNQDVVTLQYLGFTGSLALGRRCSSRQSRCCRGRNCGGRVAHAVACQRPPGTTPASGA
jgi:uncharacterized integral membrane protein